MPVGVGYPPVKIVGTLAGVYVLQSVFTWKYDVSSAECNCQPWTIR